MIHTYDKFLYIFCNCFKVSIGAHHDSEQRIAQLDREIAALKDKSVKDSKAAIAESKSLKDQIAMLKDSTKVGEKQRVIESLQNEVKVMSTT